MCFDMAIAFVVGCISKAVFGGDGWTVGAVTFVLIASYSANAALVKLKYGP